jgi:serine/threonine protein kinase
MASDKTVSKKIHREKDIMLKISHPNILKLQETLYDNEYYYFLLEYA